MAVAFPFVEVNVDTKGLTPVAQRAAGVLGIVGVSNAGDAPALQPVEVSTAEEVAARFGADTALGRSLAIAMAQQPGPDTVYGVKIAANQVAEGLRALEPADDITFVALAETFAEAPAGGGAANPALVLLKTHCETMSQEGNKRIAVAAVDPGIARTPDHADQVGALAGNLKSDTSRMVLVAARGARDANGREADVAAAAAGAIAGLPVASSIVLKPLRGFSIPIAQQYAPSEITGLAKLGIVPVIDPALIVGESLHFADGTAFTTDQTLRYVDTVRLLDDIEFSLKAGLIGLIGDARINRSGLRFIVQRAGGVLDRYVLSGGVDRWTIDVPVLAALDVPEAARPQVLADLIATTRAERLVEMNIMLVLGPQVHRISIKLAPSFV